MNGYNFTERTRRVLAMSREEATRLRHEYVGTEHLLLAMLREGDGVASAVLDTLGADREKLRSAIEDTVKHGNARDTARDLPYTSRAKRVLELAMSEARDLHHSYVGTEHILLGLIAEEKGIAAQVLHEVGGIRLDAARAETVRLLGSERQSGPVASASPLLAMLAADPLPTAVDRTREELAWTRLSHALDVCARTGTAPSLTLEDDGTLTVSLGPDLVVTVDFPPSVGLRRRDG